jgi:hypothetical protein
MVTDTNTRVEKFQVGEGVLKIETIKCGTQTLERLHWPGPATIENYRPDLIRGGAPYQQTCNCLKIIKERRRKIGCGPQMGA